ncbi:MAG: hypothetical protein IPJ78_12480 [Gemmatimonadetes bacterium]|jgi:hypothetical protein|nr:hypothetical protein [Gemmatimonadota bacterium]
MIAKQKQLLETFVRVQAFTVAHPVTGPLSYGTAPETLNEVVPRIREHASMQLTGSARSRAERHVMAKLVRQLLVRHMRPIAAIARAQFGSDSNERMPVAIKMPPAGLGVTRVLQACGSMITAARPFEAVFIANGLPADFLARCTAVRDELEAMLSERAAMVGAHVGARAGLAVEIRRGRNAVDRLDAVVKAAFDGDEETLAKWRAAKRVHQLTGGAAVRDSEAAPLPQAA